MSFPTVTGHAYDISNNQGADFGVRRTFQLHPYMSVVACKRSEGKTFSDPDFQRFFIEAQSVGKTVMAYEFARPDLQSGAAGGVSAADYTVSELTKFIGQRAMGRIVLDYESVKDLAYAKAFIQRVSDLLKTANPVILYLSASRLAEFAASGDPFWHDVWYWVADYDSTPERLATYVPKGWHVSMWQYTDKWAPYPGVEVDASFLYDPISDYKLYPVTSMLEVSADGKIVQRVKYGDGRVRAYLSSNPFLRLLHAGAKILLRRRDAS